MPSPPIAGSAFFSRSQHDTVGNIGNTVGSIGNAVGQEIGSIRGAV